jgi:hypothetical protein
MMIVVQSSKQSQKKNDEKLISLVSLRRQCLMADLDSTMSWETESKENSDSEENEDNMQTAVS